jgi:hypothetical protein
LIRTNTGVHRLADDGSYRFGCPARWGDAEVALAAADGDAVVFAGNAGVFRSSDGGCTASRLDVPEGETPVVVRAGVSGLWLVTRSFGEGTASLWAIDEDAERVVQWTDFVPDGLVVDADGALWLSGALPSPQLRRWVNGAEQALAPAWPATEAPLDRLSARLAEPTGGVWLVAGAGDARSLWWTDGEAVEPGPGPAVAVHGPVALGEARIAALDGRVWRWSDGAWADTGRDVDWTCLTSAPGAAYACALREVRWVRGWTDDGPDEAAIASIDQVSGPDPTCASVDGACAQDWLHYGGESGWINTAPAVCPGDARAPVEADDAPAPDPEGCGCAAVDRPALGALGLWAVAARLRRRARSQAR